MRIYQGLLTCLLIIFSQCLSAQRTIIYCGRLIDPKSLQVLNEMTIIVEGKTISDVQKGYLTSSSGDQVIDLKSRTVMPGLIDCHVHLEGETTADQVKEFRENIADIAFESTVYAKTTLYAGFTTVRDVGGSGVNISLRNAIRNGTVIGPQDIYIRKSDFLNRRSRRSDGRLPKRPDGRSGSDKRSGQWPGRMYQSGSGTLQGRR